MLDWHSCQICYPLEIKLLLLFASHYDKLTHIFFFFFFFVVPLVFAILRHFSKCFGRGQLTYISTLFLGSLPGSISPFGAHSFVNN